MLKNKYLPLIPLLGVVTLSAVGILHLTIPFSIRKSPINSSVLSAATSNPVRGTPGDFWADIEIGKRDFSELSVGEVVPYKLSNPGGVIVDRSVSPGRLYVWDSGNSRIIGVNLSSCYQTQGGCSADIVIGQPQSSDYGACNMDASYQTYPNRHPSNASTLCGMSELTHTTAEDGSSVSMYVDSVGNLYVPDARNHRILKYISPFTTDTIADEVWGQEDFSGNGCNKTGLADGGKPIGSAPAPSASTLCFQDIGSYGAGVTLDADGNMWVSDGGNNRVLRFPKDGTGKIQKTADIVLGQPNFTTGGDYSYCEVTGSESCAGRMWGPMGLRFDASGKLYVADHGNNRILVYSPPYMTGMSPSGTFGNGFNDLTGIEIDPSGKGIWTLDNQSWDARVRLWDANGNFKTEFPKPGNKGTGSIGIDADGNVLNSLVPNGYDVYKYSPQQDGNYVLTKKLFSPPYGPNIISSKRLQSPGWPGVTVAGNQLIVSDGRLLFWNMANGLSDLQNGKAPDGYIGTGSIITVPDPGFSQMKSDNSGRIWVSRVHSNNAVTSVEVYQSPLHTGDTPIKTITFPLNVAGGGQLTLNGNAFLGLVPSPDGSFLWVSDTMKHRVLRVSNPLTNPVVDVIIGQTSITGTSCNKGQFGEGPNADLTMLCFPGALSLDKKGNLYISDHYIETAGNWRILMFSGTMFPTNPPSVVLNPTATKEFPLSTPSSLRTHMNFETAFNSKNYMVVGNNPYSGKRFLDYYLEPDKVNSANARDPLYAEPSGQFKDFYGWPVAATFDVSDNLYVYDANRGKVMIYKDPFMTLVSQTPTPLPTSTPAPTGAPTRTPTPTRSITPTRTPKPTITPTLVPNTTMTVSSIQMGYSINGSNRIVTTKVLVIDEKTLKPLSATTVYVNVRAPSGKINSFSGNTNSSGQVTFTLTSKEKGTYNSAVTNAVKAGYVYHPTKTTSSINVR